MRGILLFIFVLITCIGFSSADFGNETCIRIHSAGESFYSVGACFIEGNDSLSGLNYTCSYHDANEYFCLPTNKDGMIKILPYDFRLTNSTGNYAYNIFTNTTFLLVFGCLIIVCMLLMALLWYGTKYIRF